MGKAKGQEFGSLREFYDYICNTPLNEVFRWEKTQSVAGSYEFTKTHTFDEATAMFKNGWDDMAKKIEQKLQVELKKLEPTKGRKSFYDVAGYQAVVPRMLQGLPTTMINQKAVPKKQKVVTINKIISFSAFVTPDELMENNIRAMMIVHKLEQAGYRVNLNIVWGGDTSQETVYAKVRIKSASERLNVSKLAFPLVHSSMVRRLFFRWMEVTPNVTSKAFTGGYGMPKVDKYVKEDYPDETVLPAVLKDQDVQQIVDAINQKGKA